jgi:diguanylate cyclase (GGDEF)-like protein/PAS domain S-box-containing protein
MSRVAARPDRTGILHMPGVAVAAAAVPVAGVFLWPGHLQHYEALSWLLLLPAAFHWAYRQAWRGVASAIAFGIAAVAVTYAIAQALGHRVPDLLLAVMALYAALTLVMGVLTVRLARAEQAAAAERLSLLDDMTGLPNRRHAELHLQMEIAAAERGRALSVVLFDIDHMQQFNARNGRAAGDAVLKGFASLLRQQTRRMDLAARFGPEAFVAILAGCMEEGAVIFAGRVQEQLRAARQTAPLPTVSAGIAVYSPDMLTAEDLLDAAAEALRLAKTDGRDRVRIHGRGIDELREPDSGAVQRAASESLAQDARGVPGLQPFDALSRMADGIGHGRSALIATADAEARSALLQVLEQEGFRVVNAEPSPDAARQLQHDFDLAFVDLAAPGPAAALIREIRFRSPTTRVVGIAATGSEDVPADLLRIRVDGHFVAAADEATLRGQMRELLAEHDALTTVQLRQRHQQSGLGDEAGARHAAVDARYRAIVLALGDVVFSTDVHGRFTLLNPAWTALTGRVVEESLGHTLWDFAATEDRETLRTDVERLLRGDTSHAQLEVRLGTRAGSTRWVDLRLRAAGGAGGGLAGTMTDVSDSRRENDALRRREAVFRSLADNAEELMAVVNADATFRYVGPAARTLLGVDPDSCEGSGIFERIHPDDLAAARTATGRLLDEPGRIERLTVRVRHVDGSWRGMEAYARSLLLTEGVEGIVVSARELPDAVPAGTHASDNSHTGRAPRA